MSNIYFNLLQIKCIDNIRGKQYCWRNRNELISNIFLWTPEHGHTGIGWSAKIYIHHLCANTECCLEDLSKVMVRKRQMNPFYQHDLMMMMMMIVVMMTHTHTHTHIYIYKYKYIDIYINFGIKSKERKRKFPKSDWYFLQDLVPLNESQKRMTTSHWNQCFKTQNRRECNL